MNIQEIISRCKPAQNYLEFEEMLNLAKSLEPKTILVIGVFQCGSMRVLNEVLDPALLIGIDDTEIARENADKFGLIVLASMRSQDRTTVELVKEILGEHTIDLLFIDGGHRLFEVDQDFRIYSQFLSNKAMVIFHDIAVADYDFCQVQSYWKSIRNEYNHIELIHSVGTGIIFWGYAPGEVIQ